MKRLIVMAVTLIFTLSVILSGCNADTPKEKLSVVCTIFPQYDWVYQILGDKADDVELTLLLDSSIDLHNYQPSVEDIVKVSSCDLFIYVGGESDDWVDDILKDAINEEMVVINLLDALGAEAKLEEVKEGMEDDHENEIENDDEYDEHIWLSLKNAKRLCSVITDALSTLDEMNAQEYQNNLAAYTKKLLELDGEYQAGVDAVSIKTLLFADRFPFRYLVDDYGIGYYAAFSGCSAETEASFDTIVYLADKVDELGLHTVMVTESSDRSIANTIISNTASKDQQVILLDSMQSAGLDDITNGTTYLSIMEKNLSLLKEALK